jgi:hypothetical protein
MKEWFTHSTHNTQASGQRSLAGPLNSNFTTASRYMSPYSYPTPSYRTSRRAYCSMARTLQDHPSPLAGHLRNGGGMFRTNVSTHLKTLTSARSALLVLHHHTITICSPHLPWTLAPSSPSATPQPLSSTSPAYCAPPKPMLPFVTLAPLMPT